VSRRRLFGGAVFLVLAFAGGGTGHASVVGPNDSISQAYGPMLLGVTYPGSFTRPDDVDYLFFDVATPGASLHFTVRNTVATCYSPDLTGCPVYGTLVTGAGEQVGGEGSSAGTGPVLAGETDVIDWTFPQPGRYFLAMDSGGDLETYAVTMESGVNLGYPMRFIVATPTRPARAIISLRVRSPQRGTAVRAVVRLGRRVPRLRSELLLRRRTRRGVITTTVGRMVLRNVAYGRRRLTVRLTPTGRALLKSKGRLNLKLRVTASPRTAGDKPSDLRVIRRVTVRR